MRNANLSSTATAAILHNGLAVTLAEDENDAFRQLLSLQGQSVDYATTEGGWSIQTLEPDVRGWRHYLQLTVGDVHHYSSHYWDAFTARAVRNVAELIEQLESHYADRWGGFRDYVACPDIIAPQLSAIRTALNYVDKLSPIAGRLDSWVVDIAARVGITEDLDYVG